MGGGGINHVHHCATGSAAIVPTGADGIEMNSALPPPYSFTVEQFDAYNQSNTVITVS